MEFSKRLFYILSNANISNAELSRATGISTARISNFYNGKDMPSLNNALTLANYFKCSMDFLLGLSDNKNFISKKREYSSEIFLRKIEILLSVNLISQRKFCKEIGINKSCISNWRRGQKPKTSNLLKIAKFFNCSIEYLLRFEGKE